MTTTATMAATSSILILAILAGSLLPSGAQFADPPPPSNETMPDSITVVDVGNDTTAVPEEPVAEMEGEYNQGVEDCIYADSPLSRRQVIADGYPTLWAAAQASGLTDAPENISQKLTLFAPTDEAFSKFFEENGLSPEEVLANQPLVLEVLTYHAVPAVKDFESLASEPQDLPTLKEGSMLTIGTNSTVVGEASNATIAKGNIWSCNAVIHEIDTVLLPQSAVDALTGGAP